MSLEILGIMYAILFTLALVLQVFLYRNKNERKLGIYFLNTILGVLLSYLAFSSLPSNFEGQRIVALIVGALAIIGCFYKFLFRKDKIIGKIMISLSIVGGFIQLFI